jgi:hypothetical protein
MEDVAQLLERQSGVISRCQALQRGLAPHDVRRLVRRNEWAPILPGVLVDHTGPPTWLQRAWAATLVVAPAALSGTSALRVLDGPGRRTHDDGAPIHVATDRQRKVVAPAGIVLHRVTDLDSRTLWAASPPRMRVEEAVIDVAASADRELDAIAAIADTVQARRTTAPRILATLERRQRVGRRSFLEGVLGDVSAGTCSVLEHGYLNRVERPHGLPVAARQLRDSLRGPLYRDVVYRRFGQVVELDGRLFHASADARDRDLDRDLDAAVGGLHTVRLGWGQVFDRACSTALRIGALLQARGWSGVPVACPSCPARSIGATG